MLNGPHQHTAMYVKNSQAISFVPSAHCGVTGWLYLSFSALCQMPCVLARVTSMHHANPSGEYQPCGIGMNAVHKGLKAVHVVNRFPHLGNCFINYTVQNEPN